MTTLFRDLTDERAQAFRDVIRDYGDLPRPQSTEIKGHGETGIRMQFLHLDDLVQWSIRFGTPVQLFPTRMFVRVSTTLLVDGVFLLAWVHLDMIEAHGLLVRCGFDLADKEFQDRYNARGVEVPASHAFAMSTLASAS